MENEDKWFLIRAATGHEMVVKQCLEMLGYQVYSPMVTEYRRQANKRHRQAVQVAVFPGYIFVDLLPMERKALQIEHFHGPVFFDQIPATISAAEMTRIKDIFSEGGFDFGDHCHTYPTFQAGMEVEVIDGLYEGMHGVVQKTSSNNQFVVLQGLDFTYRTTISVYKIRGMRIY